MPASENRSGVSVGPTQLMRKRAPNRCGAFQSKCPDIGGFSNTRQIIQGHYRTFESGRSRLNRERCAKISRRGNCVISWDPRESKSMASIPSLAPVRSAPHHVLLRCYVCSSVRWLYTFLLACTTAESVYSAANGLRAESLRGPESGVHFCLVRPRRLGGPGREGGAKCDARNARIY